MKKVRYRLERFLHNRGFTSAAVRSLLMGQLALAGASLVAGLCAWHWTLWPLLFAAGAVIGVFNLWHTARFAQLSIRREFSPALAVRLISGFTARLLLTGIAIFTLIVPLRAPVIPLLLGVTASVAGIALWGISRFSQKTVKEA